jgi:hypothetical protein
MPPAGVPSAADAAAQLNSMLGGHDDPAWGRRLLLVDPMTSVTTQHELQHRLWAKGATVDEITFRAGQLWRYRTRSDETNSRVLIQLVERDAELGEIVHIRLLNLEFNIGLKDKITVMPHVPYAGDALRNCLTALESSDQGIPSDFLESYKLWRNTKGRVHSQDIASFLDNLEMAIRIQSLHSSQKNDAPPSPCLHPPAAVHASAKSKYQRSAAQREANMKVVTDRILVLGLDKLYREHMILQESVVLLPAARRVASTLGIGPVTDVAEGYYDTNELREYFGLMRALQQVESCDALRVEEMPEYRLLNEVCSSKLYGFQPVSKGIFHVGRDSLSEALDRAAGFCWEVEGLVQAAAAVAVSEDDYSLVGLAARIMDAACITATRESTVLYAELMRFGIELGEYDWMVTPEMQELAGKFVVEFRRLFHIELPAVKPENAQRYYSAYQDNPIWGRCVRVGYNPYTTPPMNYYWGIENTEEGNDHVSDFWSSELWTTDRYRAQLMAERNANGPKSST